MKALLKSLLYGLLFFSIPAAVVVAVSLDDIRARDAKSRDIVFQPAPACRGDVVLCAEKVHFNGDWRGTLLCRAGHCVRYEDVFPQARVVGPEERK